jgi:hypothetical protein
MGWTRKPDLRRPLPVYTHHSVAHTEASSFSHPGPLVKALPPNPPPRAPLLLSSPSAAVIIGYASTPASGRPPKPANPLHCTGSTFWSSSTTPTPVSPSPAKVAAAVGHCRRCATPQGHPRPDKPVRAKHRAATQPM